MNENEQNAPETVDVPEPPHADVSYDPEGANATEEDADYEVEEQNAKVKSDG